MKKDPMVELVMNVNEMTYEEAFEWLYEESFDGVGKDGERV